MANITYTLVHVINGGDHLMPLVQSQTFEQAWFQSREAGPNKPISCEVWIFLPFRSILSRGERKFIKNLRDRFKGIKIRTLYGINRFRDFPMGIQFRYYRFKLGKSPVIFHCRGESAHRQLRQYLLPDKDRTVLDVRGYWAAEYFYRDGIEDVQNLDTAEKQVFNRLHNSLFEEVNAADALITVSESLADLVNRDLMSPKPLNIVPCGVGKVLSELKKSVLATKLRISEECKIIVYSGGYAKYQHLEDLTLPFVSKVMQLLPTTHLLILSHDFTKIKEHIHSALIPSEKVSYLSVPQSEVSQILSGCDLGLLIRKPSLVNRLAQPVKVGEYLAAGVPICFHEGTTGITALLNKFDAGIQISLDGRDENIWNIEANRVVTYLKVSHEKKRNAINLAIRHFLWSSLVLKQRVMYVNILNK